MVSEQDRARAQAVANQMVNICNAFLEAIEASGTRGIPSGHLYAFTMPVLNINQYNTIIDVLIRSGRVKRSNHVLYSTLAEL